jgi:hypothetical protein
MVWCNRTSPSGKSICNPRIRGAHAKSRVEFGPNWTKIRRPRHGKSFFSPNLRKFESSARHGGGAHAFVGRAAPPGSKQPARIGAIPARFPRCTKRSPHFRVALGVEEGDGEEGGADPAAATGSRERCRGSAAPYTAPWRRAATAAPSSPAPSAPRSAPSSTTPARPSPAAPGSSPYGPTPRQRPPRAPLTVALPVCSVPGDRCDFVCTCVSRRRTGPTRA